MTYLACIWSHVCWCTSAILTSRAKNAPALLRCGEAVATLGVRRRSLETLITDSLSPAAPLGIVLLHDYWDVWFGQHHPSQANLANDPVWVVNNVRAPLSVCCSLSCYDRTCMFVGSPWGEQTLVFFKILPCRQSNLYFSTNQGKLPGDGRSCMPWSFPIKNRRIPRCILIKCDLI